MTIDPFSALIESLDVPGSNRLRSIMEYLMTPDQARMVLELPGTPQEVAEKTGINLDRVKAGLDELFFKGVVIPRGDFRRRESFRFARSIGSFHDAVAASEDLDMVKDRQFFEMWYDFVMNEMYPGFAERFKRLNRKVDRIVPAYKAIMDIDGILPYENFPEMLKAQERIAVVPCSCRLITASVGKTCAVHDEIAHKACIQFGRAADYAVTRGSGREISLKEALELNDIIEESGLLHKWENHSTIVGPHLSCQCCRDCCMMYVPVDQSHLDISLIWEKSRFQAYVDLDNCTGCQICVDRCLFDAVNMMQPQGSKKYKAIINPEKCFGCGVCVVGCKPGAIKMKVVRPPEHVPSKV